MGKVGHVQALLTSQLALAAQLWVHPTVPAPHACDRIQGAGQAICQHGSRREGTIGIDGPGGGTRSV